MLLLIAERPSHGDFLALVFDSNDAQGYRSHDLDYDCARRTYSAGGRYVSWENPGRFQYAENLAVTLQRRYAISPGALNRVVVCDRAHEGGGTVEGHEQAVEEGRKWQRLNASPAILRQMPCDELLQLMSDAMTEYRFSEQFARISDRTLAVARSKRCEWTNDFR